MADNPLAPKQMVCVIYIMYILESYMLQSFKSGPRTGLPIELWSSLRFRCSSSFAEHYETRYGISEDLQGSDWKGVVQQASFDQIANILVFGHLKTEKRNG